MLGLSAVVVVESIIHCIGHKVENPQMTTDKTLWQSVSPSGQTYARLVGNISADVVVIGAGFLGLSSALQLAKKGLSVVVLEAQEVGSGASGLNNGQVIPVLPTADPDALIDRYGEAGERYAHLIRDSAQDLFELVRTEGLDCEAEQSGWIQPAHTPGRVKSVSEKRYREWRKHGANVALLNKVQTDDILGSKSYYGSFYCPTGGHINPLALARELARVAHDNSARIFEHSSASIISKQTNGWSITTSHGAVQAKSLILATNTYTDRRVTKLAPEIARTFIPILSWQLATAPLSVEEHHSILPARQAVSDTRGDLHFFRYDARNRLVSGGALALPFNAQARLKRQTAQRLATLFPQMASPQFDFVWSGYIGVTADRTPHIHCLGQNGWAWAGCNGRGVALSVCIGRELARAVSEEQSTDLPFPVSPIKQLPMHGLLKLLAPTAGLVSVRQQDRLEQ